MTDQPATLAEVPDLSKWPRLLVIGQPVTEQQANEIIIRTTTWRYLFTNDKEWATAIHRAAGITMRDNNCWPDMEAANAFVADMCVLPLEYLANHRIVSPHIIGPHGWCDWDGTIACWDYNIGKWPTIETVWEEWVTIADAFPYLNLTAQLVPREGAAPQPVVEFRVFGGRVSVRPSPPRQIHEAGDVSEARVIHRLLAPGGERGVTLDRLNTALAQVRARRVAP